MPYPLPEGALRDAIERLRKPRPGRCRDGHDPRDRRLQPASRRRATATASCCRFTAWPAASGPRPSPSNLAWELATIDKTEAPARLPARPRPAVRLGRDLSRPAAQGGRARAPVRHRRSSTAKRFMQVDADLQRQAARPDRAGRHAAARHRHRPRTSAACSTCAQANFDFVVIDMPTTVVAWTETVLSRAHVYFALMELDLRSAQNMLRLDPRAEGRRTAATKSCASS